MNRTYLNIKSDDDKERIAAEFINQFGSGALVGPDTQDVITTIGDHREVEIITTEGQAITNCISEISQVNIKSESIIVMIQAANIIALQMGQMEHITAWVETLPEDTNVVWGVAPWQDPTDSIRITLLLPR